LNKTQKGLLHTSEPQLSRTPTKVAVPSACIKDLDILRCGDSFSCHEGSRRILIAVARIKAVCLSACLTL
jgi:hypothetical protein